MAQVASIYLPAGAATFVTIGAIAAIMTALNGTIFVPSRLAIMFVEDGLAPRWLGFIDKKTATPIRGLTLTLACCAILLVSRQLSLALNVAVFALVVLYFIHSLVFLFLPRLNPPLASEIKVSLPRRVQQAAAIVSLLSMGLMILIQLRQDVGVLSSTTLSERISNQSLTSIELIVVWGVVGAGLYQLARMQRGDHAANVGAHGD
jgi:amino acid transporter